MNACNVQGLTPKVFVLWLLFAVPAFCETYYVNNKTGNDANNGLSTESSFATITKAISTAKTSDKIVLADTGIKYRESIVMDKKGGTPASPFIIEGNGAVITGLRTIKPEEWKPVKDGVYLLTVAKKPYAYPYLANHGKKLRTGNRDKLGPEEHSWEKDGIYFRCGEGKTPASYDLSATLIDECGFAVRNASYIICRNLVSECVANDGFSLHGDCRGVYLENVEARYNGNKGISIHETCEIVVRNAYLHHNMQGIVDVNASRSFYDGILAESNDCGAAFNGGFHSLVDCVFRDNTSQLDITAVSPKHLIGAEFNPICRTMLFAKNVIITGTSTRGLRVNKGTQAIMENSIINGCKTGILVEEGGVCHLTASVITDCGISLSSDSSSFFRDYNIYFPGKMQWLGTAYSPEEWDMFRKKAGHDEHSMIGPLTIKENGELDFPPGSSLTGMQKKAGPTQPVIAGENCGSFRRR